MPSATQKSTHVNSVIGFSKNSVDCWVVLKIPPANATSMIIVPIAVRIGPSRRRRTIG